MVNSVSLYLSVFPHMSLLLGRKFPKKEKIRLNVNSGTGTEILCKATSHLLKELRRQVGKLGFLYEAEVQTWSRADFNFSYTVSSNNIFGGVLMQSPSVHDFDQREMFCFYLFPGSNISGKVFRKEVVFIVDISRSMRGRPLENTKDAVLAALLNLNTQDSFNIIAFNGDTCLFSSTMVLATKEEVGNATQWINTNFTAEGGTNILNPLSQAIEMLTKTSGSMPLIFLITDGAVEDERHICNVVEGHLRNRSPICPRICTFGIGSYCNHYFLQMLAQIGRGYYDAAYDADSIAFHMQRLFTKASSVILANITIETLEHLDSLELFPFHIPDLSSGSPLIISGRYHGEFPESLKASGSLADMSNFTLELKIRKAKEIPLDRVFARRQINLLTVQAWLSESKQLEDKIAKMSMQTGFPSEYTRMILLVTDKGKQASESVMLREKMVDSTGQKIILLGTLGIGFGNLTATSENLPSGVEEPKPPEGTDVIFKAATNCCAMVADRICCMCFIQACSKLNNQCAIAFTQLCSALTCFGCMDCCCELCVSCG